MPHIHVPDGFVVNSSKTGTSGSRHNPFVVLARRGTDENSGEAFMALILYIAETIMKARD